MVECGRSGPGRNEVPEEHFKHVFQTEKSEKVKQDLISAIVIGRYNHMSRNME